MAYAAFQGTFRGIFPAPVLVPAPFGILSVADVLTSDTDTNNSIKDDWIRGYSVDFNTRPQVVELLDKFEDSITGGDVSATSTSDNLFENYNPFFIQVQDNGSGMGILGLDRRARIAKQIEAVTQKAVEYELWSGVVALAEASEDSTDDIVGGPFLSQATASAGSTVLTTGGVDPRAALWQLEMAITNSPTGAPGVIHMSRDVASFLTQNQAIQIKPGPNGEDILQTALGTPVIAGAGYTGAGPIGTSGATPTSTNKWAYVTGAVGVILGDSEIVNKDYSQGFDTATNDYHLRAYRPACVHFDPSIFYSAQITIPATP